MDDTLTVTLVQTALHWQDPAANRATLREQLTEAGSFPTDLIVLPEMFSTGFSMDAAHLAERPAEGSPTLTWMQELAARHAAVVTGSFIVEEAGNFYNRLYWVRPDGTSSHYDKRHLFPLAGEPDVYTPGQAPAPLVEEWRGWRICPLICYDLRFPVWSRNRPHAPYDVLLYVANWPAARAVAWNTLLRARAIENVAYTVGVNRIGPDGHGHEHAGDSALLDMRGSYLAQAGSLQTTLTRTLPRAPLEEFRRSFPALASADAFVFE